MRSPVQIYASVPWSFSRGSDYNLSEAFSHCYNAIIPGLRVVLRTGTQPSLPVLWQSKCTMGSQCCSKSLFWNRWEDLKTCFGMISMHKIVRFLRHLISAFYNLKVIMMVTIRFSTGFKYQLPLIEPNLKNTSWVNQIVILIYFRFNLLVKHL